MGKKTQAKKDWNRRNVTRVNDIVIHRNEPCPCGCGQKAKNHILKSVQRPITQLAKKEYEKQRKYMLNKVKRDYEEKTDERKKL